MAQTIKLGYSNTSGQTPNTLDGGELATNTSNRKIWVGNGSGNTLVFNHADYAPASANASQSFVTSQGYITDGNTGWNNSYGFVTSSGVTSVATSGAINGGTITGTGTISHSTAAGNKHVPTGGSSGQFLKYSSSGTAVWATPSYTSLSGYATESYCDTYTDQAIDLLINSAPGALNTLNELAAALGDDASFSTTITNALAGKQASGTYNTVIGTDNDVDTAGAEVIDTMVMTDGVVQSFTTRDLTLGNLGYTGATNANNFTYTHPTGAGNKHIPTGGSSGQFLKYSSSGTAVWAADNNTTYTLASLGYTGATNANHFTYTHPTGAGNKHIPTGGSAGQFLKYSSSGTAIWAADNNTTYTLASLGYTGATNANNFTYSHPSHPGDDFGVDTGALSGATVVSDIDINVSTDTQGHVTDANGTVSTRTLTLANLGYTGATNATYTPSYNVSASNSTIVQRHASGYIFSNYINTTADVSTTLGYLAGRRGDDTYHRWYSAATVRTFLGVAANANNYSHPTGAGNNHIPTGGSAGQFLKYSSSGVATWAADNNTTYTLASLGYTGATNANNFTYTHPTGAGNKHIPTGGSAGQFLKYSSSGTAIWAADNNTTYTLASLGYTGATNANNFTYTHPTGAGNKHIPTGGSSGQFLKYSSSGTAIWAADNNTTYTLSSLGYTGATNANNYSHPTGAGNKHIPTGGSSGQFLKYSSSGTAIWAADNNTTYTLSSLGYTGATNANNYSHPTGAGNNHIPTGGASNKFLKWSSSGVATWEYDNTGVFSITAGYGLTGGNITGIGTIAHSTANGYKHIPSNGSAGQFLGYSSTGTATWVGNPNTDTNTTYSASTGLYMSGTDIRHSDTSSQSSSNNSGTTFIQDITLDGYGHVTAIGTGTASGGGTTTWNGLENMSALSYLP